MQIEFPKKIPVWSLVTVLGGALSFAFLLAINITESFASNERVDKLEAKIDRVIELLLEQKNGSQAKD